MDTFSCRLVVLGIVICSTISSVTSIANGKVHRVSNLMLDFNWPEPDRSINKFPHESSCHHYYLMPSEEDISVEKCPDGELFDYFAHKCVAKEMARCWSRHFENVIHGHRYMKLKKHFKCPYPYGKFPNTHDCSKYYLCLHNKAKLKKCAPFEYFDKIARKCVAEIDAICADVTDVAEPDYRCPKSWGSFPFSKDCSKYYECQEKKPALRTCQTFRLFDEKRGKCVPKDHAHCGSKYNPYEEIATEVQTQEPLDRSTPVVTSKDTKVKRTRKESSDEDSSSSEETSSEEKTSDAFVKTSSGLTPIPKIQSTSTPVSSDSSKKLSTIQFIISEVASTKRVSDISENLPSSTRQARNLKEESSPGASIIPTDTTSNQLETSSVKHDSVPTEDINDILATFPDRSMSTGLHSLLTDSIEKEFIEVSTDRRGSEIPTVAPSSENPTATPSEGQQTSASIQDTTLDAKHVCLPEDNTCYTDEDGNIFRCPISDGLFPHPKDETRFLHCTNFKPYIKTCPSQLIFDPRKRMCGWKMIL